MEAKEVPHDSLEYERAYSELTQEYIQICIFSSLIGVIGILGNLVSISFYLKQNRSPINILIIALSIVDFGVSILSFLVVYETIANIKLESDVACKIFYFLYYWFISLSITLVTVIAVERYREVCKSTERQVTPSEVKKIIAFFSLFMMCTSLRSFVTLDISQANYQLDGFYHNATKQINTSLSAFKGDHTTGMQEVPNNSTELYSGWTTIFYKTKGVFNISTPVFDNSSKPFNDTSRDLYYTSTQNYFDNMSISEDLETLVILVHICTFSRRADKKVFVVSFHIYDMVFVFTVIVVFVYCYTNVIRKLMVHRKATKWLHDTDNKVKRMNAEENVSASGPDHESDSTEITFHDRANSSKSCSPLKSAHNGNRQAEIEVSNKNSDLSLHNTDAHGVVTKSTWTENGKSKNGFIDIANENASEKQKQRKCTTKIGLKKSVNIKSHRVNVKTSEIQITMAMLTVSVLLLLSFVPYFISSIYIQFLSTKESALNTAALFMIRCAFINSVLNCFIYYIFSQAYRDYVKYLFCRFSNKK